MGKELRKLSREGGQVPIAKAADVKTSLIGYGPQLPRRDQAHPSPQQKNSKSQVNQRHSWIPFQEQSTGWQYGSDPQR